MIHWHNPRFTKPRGQRPFKDKARAEWEEQRQEERAQFRWRCLIALAIAAAFAWSAPAWIDLLGIGR